MAKKLTVQKSPSGVTECNSITRSCTKDVNRAKISVNPGDFATYNKFSVLSDEKTGETVAVNHDIWATASETATPKKVSKKKTVIAKK